MGRGSMIVEVESRVEMAERELVWQGIYRRFSLELTILVPLAICSSLLEVELVKDEMVHEQVHEGSVYGCAGVPKSSHVG